MENIAITTVIVTGGIATGKSAFCESLARFADPDRTTFFDADRCVHELLTRRDVGRTISEEFGSSVIGSDGTVSRPALREAIFARSPTGMDGARKRLEAILHPQVRDAYRSAFEAAAQIHPGGLFIADIPLYFESEPGAYYSDHVTVVACTPETQRLRASSRGKLRGVSADATNRILAAQLPIGEKVSLADHLVWNDGSTSALDGQARLFLGLFTN